MATVTYREYNSEKTAFFEKHGYDYKIDTTSMDEYGRYGKTYTFEDGATWYEAMGPSYEQVVVEVRLVKIPMSIKMFCTEYWNSENSASKCYYEKF